MSKVAIIGDVIVDKYIYGTSTRLSPEAPVPIVQHQTTTVRSGGAGNLYENLKSLDVDVTLLDFSNPKCIKTRVFCDGHYVTRIDDDHITAGYQVLAEIKKIDFSKYDFVILSDYNKGVLDYAQGIIKHINSFNCKIIVDPKRKADFYNDTWLIKPNKVEYEKFNFSNWRSNLIVTCADGPVSATIDNNTYEVVPELVEVNDVTGAGDCFLAAFVYGLTKEYNYQTCLELAVKGATESVKHVGTYTLNLSDLNENVIFTNGVFDILHRGHFELLKTARSLGDKLIVGINSDDSVRRLKGPTRPINNEFIRMEQLLSLPWVDDVIIFEEDTPYNLIKNLHPRLIVKGGDYSVESVVGNDIAPVYIMPTIEGYSTTRIIEATK
jgi:D-beta-D-heptose 7-phosphate kinase/D-beta-D-heptose 1-phosphate adenosyltransferase